ncbi:MAG: hypothetical protein ACRDRZ_11590 [Pseudonocardiaceae bacterium]
MTTSQPHQTLPDELEPDAGIADALAATDGLDAVPVAEHVTRFHTLHESLTAALSTIDEV